MRSGSTSDRGGKGRAETDTEPTVASTAEAIERQLTGALDASETARAQFHLRQALQLVKALEE